MTIKFALLVAALSSVEGAARAGSCESLTGLVIPSTPITGAVTFPAENSFPARCRVTALARPVADSEIAIEIWLPPADQWNGKFVGTGNGGYSGAIRYVDMEAALRQGYAVAGSNTGHDGDDLKFGHGHPEKINDWAFRAVHVMTETAKVILRSYYGRFQTQSYFVGCSTGGQQALTEAERYPDDYDGIVAGAPGNNRVRLNIGFLWSWIAANQPGNEFPAYKLPLLHQAVIGACDALDGVKDGIISDPRTCHFNPAALLCKAANETTCLTQSEVSAVQSIYGGARNPRTGEKIYSGWSFGSEASEQGNPGGWSTYFVGQREPARADFWRYWVFNDPNWNYRNFDFDRDVAYADKKMAFLTANDPDLSPFQKHNGKLLMYHGWADPVVATEDTIRYFESVRGAMSTEKASGSVRLFLVPGMGHCGGGPGPNTFDMLSELNKWVISGNAPDKIVASHSRNGAVDRTRPLCSYPRAARWNGTGNSDDAASFTCSSGGRP